MLYRLFLFNCYVFTVNAVPRRWHYANILAAFIVIFIKIVAVNVIITFMDTIVVVMLCVLLYGNVVPCLCLKFLCHVFVVSVTPCVIMYL